MDNFSITRNGKPLDESLYSIDLETKVFSSKEHHIVLDFLDCNGWKFTTGSCCTFNTGDYCTFTTSWGCTFSTGWNCTFDTDESCTFMLYYINTCKFKSHDDISIILDRNDNKHYILTKDLIDMLKVING